MSKEFFEDKIMPFFYQYREQMLWRMDIADYDDVKANAVLLCLRIDPKASGDNRMPPPPYPPFSDQLIADFKQWMTDEGISYQSCCPDKKA